LRLIRGYENKRRVDGGGELGHCGDVKGVQARAGSLNQRRRLAPTQYEIRKMDNVCLLGSSHLQYDYQFSILDILVTRDEPGQHRGLGGGVDRCFAPALEKARIEAGKRKRGTKITY
jgi:hypothetical protein